MNLDYSWIADLQNALQSNNIFSATITGAKSFALAMLMFQTLKTFINSTSNNYEAPVIGNMMQVIGIGLVVVSSDWIITLVDNLFAGVSVYGNQQGIPQLDYAKSYLQNLDDQGAMLTGIDKVAFYFSIIKNYLSAVIIQFVYMILQVIDFAITSMYLLQRLFMVKLFIFIFPIALALSTTPGYNDMLPRWVKIYIGLFILGIAYNGVMAFSFVVYDTIAPNFTPTIGIDATSSIDEIALGQIGALLVTFAIKISLMGFVTKEVRSYFS